MTNLKHITEHATKIASDAGKVALQYFRSKELDIIVKSDESPVTIADQLTEKFIRSELACEFPSHGIYGEEFGVSGDLGEKCWIIDPIDGTRFFITGYPAFGILLAHLVEKHPRIGVVHMPALNESFSGYEDGPAMLNGKIINCSKVTRLDEAKIYINEAEKMFLDDPARFRRLCVAGHTRRMSYDCYPHAMVAAGRIDAVIDMGLQPYDFLPLVALIQSAGGIITDWNGETLTLNSDGRVLTASTPELHSQMLAMI